MVRRRDRQHQAEKRAQREAVSGAPRDRALCVQAFEITDQQQTEVADGWQPWPAIVCIESLAEAFDVLVKIMLLEDLIQAHVNGCVALRGRSCV